jgi:uncharacterized delta-60 repeat protein
MRSAAGHIGVSSTVRRRSTTVAIVVALAALLATAALALPGDLDGSFGTGGTVTTDFGAPAAAHAVTPALEGKIVVVGGAGGDFALARYLPVGTPDSTLDADGKLTMDFGGQDEANGVVVQPNGKIVAVGGSDGDFALARYRGGGKFDPSFGTQGKVTTDFGGADVATAVLRLPDGRFVVVGGTGQDFAVARYTFKGDPDMTFGTQGKVITDFGGDDRAEAVALQSDGRIVVAGRSDGDFALARYGTSGALDASFDGDALVTTDFSGAQDAALAVAIQPNTEIVVAGTTDVGGSSDFALARYLPDGSLDASSDPLESAFGLGGRVTTDFGGTDPEAVYGVAIQGNGRIVATGGALGNVALARYAFDGSLDATFGSGGMLTTDFTGTDVGEAVFLQPNGAIVVAGTTSAGDDFALARYLGDAAVQGGGVPPGIP